MTLQQFNAILIENPTWRTYNSDYLAKKLSTIIGQEVTKSDVSLLRVELKLWEKEMQDKVELEVELKNTPTEEELELVGFKSNVPVAPQGFKVSSFKQTPRGIGDVWFKADDELIPNQVDWKSEFKKAIQDVELVFPTPNYIENGKLLVINAYDVHLNKKGLYSKETLQDQVRIFEDCVTDIVCKANAVTKLEKILFVVGHDFFHNEFNKATTKGTSLDCLESPEVLFKEGFKSMIKMISLCSEFAPVDVQHVNGNHCFYGELQLLSALEVYFENAEDITITSNQRDRQYYQFYSNGFQLIHDTKKKLSDLPLVFSIESPKIFANTKNRFILSGHLHGQQQSQFLTSHEGYGIEHIQCPSIAGSDRWHEDNLYIGNKRRMLGLVIDSVYGTEQFIYSNVR